MNILYCKYLLTRIFNTIFDYKIIKLIIAIWLFFSGIHVYLYAVGALLLFDVITGVYASYRQGLAFTSKYLKKGLLEKLALYLILMLTSFAMEAVLKSVFGWEHFYVVFFVTVLISSYESISIFENILSINPSLTFLKSLISVSKRMNDAAIKTVEDKIDSVEIPAEKKSDENVNGKETQI